MTEASPKPKISLRRFPKSLRRAIKFESGELRQAFPSLLYLCLTPIGARGVQASVNTQNRPYVGAFRTLILTRGRLPSVNVSNVLNEEKKQQVIALGRLGWSLRKIQKTTGVRRETAADYLRAAGIGLRPSGGWGRSAPAKPANEVIPDPGGAQSRP